MNQGIASSEDKSCCEKYSLKMSSFHTLLMNSDLALGAMFSLS